MRPTASALVVLLLVAALSACAASRGHPRATTTFGPLPSFLPQDTTQVHRVVDATAAEPALATQGDSVRVHLGTGAPAASVLARISGPQVPVQGVVPAPTTSNCTWSVTFSEATAPVPLTVSSLSASDSEGHLFSLRVVPGAPPLPPTLQPGQTVTTEIETVMPTGEGLLRWAPRGAVLAAWDFVVEVD